MKLLYAAAIGSLLLSPAIAHAQQSGADAVSIEQAPASFRSDRAYIVARWVEGDEAIPVAVMLARVPTSAELVAYTAARAVALQAFEAAQRERLAKSPNAKKQVFTFSYQGASNVFYFYKKSLYEKGSAEKFSVIEAAPGTYMVVGTSVGGALQMCFCLGTVKFEAKPGVVTDMGSFLMGKKNHTSGIPELDAEPKWGIFGSWVIASLAVRPAAVGAPVPASLNAVPHVIADYRAVGKLTNHYGLTIDRLPPVPGALAYDDDTVIDLKAH